jgi:hypothetical protein
MLKIRQKRTIQGRTFVAQPFGQGLKTPILQGAKQDAEDEILPRRQLLRMLKSAALLWSTEYTEK